MSVEGELSVDGVDETPSSVLSSSLGTTVNGNDQTHTSVAASNGDAVKAACQVCNECSPSMRPGSLACEACKKFFMRNYDVTKKFTCENGGKCLQNGSTINRRTCQACRMERCILLGLSEKVRPPKPAIDLRFVPCAVCGASSTGYHFGILSCEGCKGFFRRTVKYDLARNFTCDTGGTCVIDPLRQKCKKCRFERCLSAGMSPTGSHIGRHTNAQRAETKREIERLQTEQKLLKAPIMVRQLKRGATAAALTGMTDSSPTSDIPSVKFEQATSPALNDNNMDDGTAPSKRRPRSRHSSGGSNLATPQCINGSTPPLAAQSLPDFQNSSTNTTQPQSLSADIPVDDATLAAAQSLMSIFGAASNSTVNSPAVSMSIDSPYQPPPPPPPQRTDPSSVGDLSGISGFLARLNAQAAAMTVTPKASVPSPASTCSTFDLTTAPTVPNSPMFSSSEFKMLGDENTRAAVLRRIRMPVPRSNFIWMYNSGADWTNIASLLSNPVQAATGLNQLRPLGDPFSLHSFIRLLASDQLLPEPPLAVLPRSEWLLAQVTNAVRNLSHIKNLRLFFDPGWTAEEVWRQGMVCFEHHTRYVLSFVRSLPGYASLAASDRTTLFTQALFPLVVAQLSLDYDMEEHEENYLSMDYIGRELMALNFPPMRQLRRHIAEAGLGIKASKLNIVEFGLVAALVFFNNEIPNIVEMDKIRQIAEEFRTAASIFVRRTYANTPAMMLPGSSNGSSLSPADERLQLVNSHIRYLSGLHQTHQSIMADFARMFPHLVTLNPLHDEMYTAPQQQHPTSSQQASPSEPPPPLFS